MSISITLPTVGGSSGTWGTTVNTALTALSTGAAALAGGNTFTGQQIIQVGAGVSTAIFEVVDSSSNPRLTFSRVVSTATQLQIIGSVSEPPILGLLVASDYADYTFDGTNTELDSSTGNISIRPLGTGGSVNVWSISNNTKLRIGSSGFGAALDLQHDGTNAHITPTTGYVGFQGDLFRILSSGALSYTGPTAASASTGSNGAPPSQVGGYYVWDIGGTTVKIPYYFT